MPGFLLHQGAVVMCLHGGQAMPIAPNPSVTLMGMPSATLTVPWVAVLEFRPQFLRVSQDSG